MKKFVFPFLSILGVVQSLRAQEVPAFVKDSLETYMQKALKDWQLPGAAVAIVKDGKVVMARGFGVRDISTKEPVDENTLFMIGSNTKAFTGTALASLQAQGKLSLDDKVQRWIPDFKLYDPWVTQNATVRDLLCHRLGFETFQGDFMYFDSDLDKEGVKARLAKVKPMYGFRSRWGYTNAAFLMAGEVIPKVIGRTWEQFVRDSFFVPLQMTRSLAETREMEGASNKAAAHTVTDGQLKKVAYGKLANMAPAGSISSSVADMTHWMLMQLDNGKYNGKQVVPASAIAETRTPATVMGNGGTQFNSGHFALYGLGWFLEEYAGKLVVSHTGGINGFVTSVTLLPEEKLGIVVLTNSDNNGLFEALKWEIMDAYLKLPYRNYHAGAFAGHQADEKRRDMMIKAKKDTIASNPKTALPLASFAGQYKHEVYGNMNIAQKDGKLIATFEHHKGRHAVLEALGGHRFLATFSDPIFGIRVWPFTIKDGRVQSVTVRVGDFVEFTPYEFVKTK